MSSSRHALATVTPQLQLHAFQQGMQRVFLGNCMTDTGHATTTVTTNYNRISLVGLQLQVSRPTVIACLCFCRRAAEERGGDVVASGGGVACPVLGMQLSPMTATACPIVACNYRCRAQLLLHVSLPTATGFVFLLEGERERGGEEVASRGRG